MRNYTIVFAMESYITLASGEGLQEILLALLQRPFF
jgi:hypothetical protein